MPAFPKPCLVCGRRVDTGESRCPTHTGQRYTSPVGCYVCGRRGPKGYCPDHDPYGNPNETERLRRQPWRAGYRTPEYRDNKKKALARAGGHCEKCDRTDLALEVDHRVPLSTASSAADFPRLNDISNLIVLCQACHRHKTQKGPRK